MVNGGVCLPDFDQAFFCGIGDGQRVVPKVPRACLPRDRVADRARLVEALKSPTSDSAAVFQASGSVEELEIGNERFLVDSKTGECREVVKVLPCREKAPGMYTVTEFRAWSDEYRIRTEARLHLEAPSPSTGDRVTWLLSDRGARKIADSCHYVALQYGGFNTFLTLTFTPEKRAAIARGGITIQKEVSRCMDGLQKIYQRDGWAARMGSQTLLYCWVVEIPKNDQGEDNPHVHVLMRWSVKKSQFPEWSARIEALWGQGFGHLEKIDDPKAAGAYMAKAAGYLTKANGADDQGMVKGNRYGISRAARAPLWAVIDEQELGAMGLLIAELHDHMGEKYGHLYRRRRALNKDRENTPKAAKWLRARIAEKLAGVRKQLAAVPVVVSKYVVTFKGAAAFDAFREWAAGDRIPGFELPAPDWLPDNLPMNIQPQTARPRSIWWHRLKSVLEDRQRNRRAFTDSDLADIAANIAHRKKCAEDMLRYWGIYAESRAGYRPAGGGAWVRF